ncbi:MAG: tRNA modification GTPase [Flavobacteriaceae bacterium]
MKSKVFFSIILLVYTLKISSQIHFEKGYFITNGNERIECLIKNLDWKNNPTEFEYKVSENAEIQNASIETVKEFTVYDVLRYTRKTVEIEKSSSNVSNLSTSRNPTFTNETLFLKVLIEGSTSLYLYEKSNLEKFFYSTSAQDIEQLVYIQYTSSDSKIRENNYFRQQLFNALKCGKAADNKVSVLRYENTDLVNFFRNFNTCKKVLFTNWQREKKKGKLVLNLRAGIANNGLEYNNPEISGPRVVSFQDKLSPIYGVEIEYIMPFNKNKWAFFGEPLYQFYNQKAIIDDETYETKYSSIDLSLGLRHYFFLDDNFKFYINASIISSVILDNTVTRTDALDRSLIISLKSTSPNFGAGIGFKCNNKFGVEIRANSARNLASGSQSLVSKYNSITLLLSYSLF